MKKLLIVACLLAVCSVSANAAVLADYRFNTDEAYASDPNVTAGNFVVGPGLAGGAGRSGTGQNMYVRSQFTGPINIGNAIAEQDYLSFTLTPLVSGLGLDLDTMTLQYGYTTNGGSVPQQFKAYLLTSIDGFVDADSIVGSQTIDVTDTPQQTPPYTAVTIDLSGLQVSTPDTPVEFRLYLADTVDLNDFIHRIDNVVVNGELGLSTLTARAPAKGADELSTDTDLTWTLNASNPSLEPYVDVYFADPDAADPNLLLVDSSNSTGTYDPGTLANETTYSWTLVTYEPNAVDPEFGLPTPNPAEPVWSFTTIGLSPDITGEPVSQTVAAGTLVTLSVTADRATAYQWFKDGAPIGGATSDSLVLPSVQLADEADYHCEAYNASFPSTNVHPDGISAVARVMTQRLAGWWKLDGDLTDSVNDDDDVTGAPEHDGTSVSPLYVGTGVVGTNALDLSAGIADNLVGIADPNFFNFYPQGYTVSCWINVPAATEIPGWGPAVSKDSGANGNGNRESGATGFRLDANSQLSHSLIGGPGTVYSGITPVRDAWHLFTATWDPDTNLSKIYVNGVIAATDAPYYGSIAGNTDQLVFGCTNVDAIGNVPGSTQDANTYRGYLDDVKIYTYALTPEEISAEYQAQFPGEQCIHPDDFLGVEYDVLGNNNCKVDLPDFAAFAAKWLGTGLFTAP